jgi:hypothetical protein
MSQLLSKGLDIAAAAGTQAWTAVTNLWRARAHSYRPEAHYMRGPGPKWRAKHTVSGPAPK